ncbi:HNH endonuclease [Burkholderia pseudomallei]
MADREATSKCWAHTLGGCDRMSGEHVFSSAIFKAGCSCPVIVEGVQRIRQGAPTRGAEKSNILCVHHNSALSPLDETIGKIARFQAESNDKNYQGSLIIKGELLERWLLKTVINNAAAGWAAPVKWQPSPSITRAIFGLEPVPDGFGLYSVDGIDPTHRPSGGVSFTAIYTQTPHGNILAGAYVAVHGMPLLASFRADLVQMLEAGHIPSFTTRFSPNGLKHLYHPGAIVIDRKEGAPVFMGLSWGGLLRYADGTTAPHRD